MAFGYHTLDDCGPWLAGVVNRAFAVIDSGDEECGLEVVGLETVEEFGSVLGWAVVICQSNISRLVTIPDVFTIGD